VKNPKLKLFFISQSLAFTYFWLAIAIPYLMYRGLSSAQAFSLMAIYQLMGVILEYPTGVIGDRFGYRKVTYLANTLNFLSMIIMAFSGNYYLYLFALSLLALGNGFSSGNDMGILKSVSTNIKKDTANYNALMDFVLFISSVVGGLLSKISYELALIISAICMFSANIPLFLLKNGITQNKNTDSIISIVKDGLRSLRNPTFKQLFIIVALFGGYSFTIKSIFGSFGNIYHIDVATIGLIVGLGGLTRSIGGKLYAEIQKQNITLATILVALSIILMGIFPTYYAVVGLMLFNQLLFGYILSKIDGDIHDLASDSVRASLFSLKRLIMRLVASSYLALYGIAVGVGQIALIMYGTGIGLLLGVVLAWGYLNTKSKEAIIIQ
jgi:ACDE family multidrug resistance protein